MALTIRHADGSLTQKLRRSYATPSIILGLIIYFVLGTYQNHQQYGVYEIPHRDFWREAPYLVQ